MKGAMEPVFIQKEGWKRIYIDLPGRGQSDATDWIKTQDQVLDAVVRFIDMVISRERFCIAGLSHGGLLAKVLVHGVVPKINGVLFLAAELASVDKESLPPPMVMHEEWLDFTELGGGEIDAVRGTAVV
jgi:alpha-beta hydrolase superfamily lysophospholipase